MKTTTSKKIQITITNEHIDSLDRLDKWVMNYIIRYHPEIDKPTRSYIHNLLEKQAIVINGKIMKKASYLLKVSDKLEILWPEVSPSELQPTNIPLDIVYEDDDIIVVNKPAGLVVHPAAGHESDTLVNALLFHTKNLSLKNEERPGIVHRIDKETSGLLVIAKNDMAHENLAAQFKDKTTHRRYYAIVEKEVKSTKGTINSYLNRHPTDRKKYASLKRNNKFITEPGHDQGKWAVTHFEVLQKLSDKSLMQLNLETGRTHQIRVHMSEMGHVLHGDITYGFSKNQFEKLKLKRFYLHAAELGFVHPRSKEFMKFKVDWPKEDKEYILSLGFSDVA